MRNLNAVFQIQQRHTKMSKNRRREQGTDYCPASVVSVILKESVGPRRVLLMALIAFGAVIVEIGG